MAALTNASKTASSNLSTPRIEYRIYDEGDGINPDDVFELNELGAEGWQLVAIKEYTRVMGEKGTRSEWGHRCHRWYFSRWTFEPLSDEHVDKMGRPDHGTAYYCWPPLNVPIAAMPERSSGAVELFP